MNSIGNLSALKFAEKQNDKKYIKKMSNAFCVPLILEQVIGTVALIIGAVALMLVRVSVFNQKSAFSLKSFLGFLSQSDNSSWLNNLFSAFTYISYMFIPFVIIAIWLRQNPLRTVPMKIQHKELIAPAIFIGLMFSVIGEFYSDYFQMLLQSVHLKVELDQFSFPDNVPALAIYFIELSVLAPICEEFIFRGMILQNLRKYGDFFAVLVSSIMFGLLHGNFSQTPFAFIVGLALGFTVVETGSIFVSMLLHCCINSISLIFSAVSYYGTDDVANKIYLLYAVVICAVAILFMMNLKKKRFFDGISERYFSYSISTPQAVGTFVKAPGFIVFLCFYALTMLATLKSL